MLYNYKKSMSRLTRSKTYFVFTITQTPSDLIQSSWIHDSVFSLSPLLQEFSLSVRPFSSTPFFSQVVVMEDSWLVLYDIMKLESSTKFHKFLLLPQILIFPISQVRDYFQAEIIWTGSSAGFHPVSCNPPK